MRTFTEIAAAQRSPAWFAARLGRLTGSRAADAFGRTKTGWSTSRQNYLMELVCERLTGAGQESGFANAAMERGVEMEPRAVAAYEVYSGELLQSSGFLRHETLMAGCSLDGHVSDYVGIVEIKCPLTKTHVGYLRSRRVPSDYLSQIRHNMWVSGAEWCDFVSYDDRLPGSLALFVERVTRDSQDIPEYEAMVREFLDEVARETDALTAMVTERG